MVGLDDLSAHHQMIRRLDLTDRCKFGPVLMIPGEIINKVFNGHNPDLFQDFGKFWANTLEVLDRRVQFSS